MRAVKESPPTKMIRNEIAESRNRLVQNRRIVASMMLEEFFYSRKNLEEFLFSVLAFRRGRYE